MESAILLNNAIQQNIHTHNDSHTLFTVQSTHLLQQYLHNDPETMEHSWRVSLLATRLARQLGCTEETIAMVRLAALLHDIGKALIPSSIIHKPEKLTPEEYCFMQQHPVYSYDIVRAQAPDTPYWRRISNIVLYHHEHWDGTGYPAQLSSTAIPYEARICAIADVWDALSSTRSYRPAWEPSAVAVHLRNEAGRSLDPQMVDVFLALQGSAAVHGELLEHQEYNTCRFRSTQRYR